MFRNRLPLQERHSEAEGPEQEAQEESQLRQTGRGVGCLYWLRLQGFTQEVVADWKYKGTVQDKHYALLPPEQVVQEVSQAVQTLFKVFLKNPSGQAATQEYVPESKYSNPVQDKQLVDEDPEQVAQLELQSMQSGVGVGDWN